MNTILFNFHDFRVLCYILCSHYVSYCIEWVERESRGFKYYTIHYILNYYLLITNFPKQPESSCRNVTL